MWRRLIHLVGAKTALPLGPTRPYPSGGSAAAPATGAAAMAEMRALCIEGSLLTLVSRPRLILFVEILQVPERFPGYVARDQPAHLLALSSMACRDFPATYIS